MLARTRRLIRVVVGAALLTAGAGCGTSGRPAQLAFSPLPGTLTSSTHAEITVRGVTAADLDGLTVVGSQSGRHGGRLVSDRDADAATLLPDQPFDPGEEVTVSLQVRGRSAPIRFQFGVANSAPVSFQAGPPAQPTRPGLVARFHSAPGLHPPVISVSEKSDATAAGDIFLGPANKLGQAGPLIVDDEGEPIWFHPLEGKLQAFGFREQPFHGRRVLTWWQGVVSSLGYGHGEDVIYNHHYQRIAIIRGAEGYSADLHDFVLTPQGTALITSYNPIRADLSSLGGSRDGTLFDCIIQELDIKTDRVLFEWHSIGHVGIDESYATPAKGQPFDYFHLNSIAVDADGNLIVSARNTWTVYKLDRRTGQIIWRLGGKDSSFKMGPGAQFAYQHDAERGPDGTITVFDNGANPRVHPESRAIAIAMNMKTMTAALAHDWRHPSKILATSQGNVQLLANGDPFVGWGGQPNLTEFSPDGRVLFDASMAPPDTSYRAYRFRWHAVPPGRPAIALGALHQGELTVYASWNGATEIARWRWLSGPSAESLLPVAETPRTGFETKGVIVNPAGYVAAEALSASGRVLGMSAPSSTLSAAGS